MQIVLYQALNPRPERDIEATIPIRMQKANMAYPAQIKSALNSGITKNVRRPYTIRDPQKLEAQTMTASLTDAPPFSQISGASYTQPTPAVSRIPIRSMR